MNPLKHSSRLSLIVTTVALLLLSALPSYGDQGVTIAQIDPSRLLTRQEADVYVSVTDVNGNTVTGLTAKNFSLFEGSPGGKLLPVPDFGFHEGVPADQGLTFFLLVDNSGSMYETLGQGAGAAHITRIEAARAAIRTFLNSVDNPADKIGFATFNTLYRVEALPTRVRSEAEAALGQIKEPTQADAYTELYASLRAAAHDLAGWKGRKVIILLTDGENYPYTTHTGKPNPQFGTTIASSSDAVRSLIREGISVFPIQFGPARQDANLQTIARSSGGRVFDASNENALANVYLSIRQRVLEEYRLTYSPRMLPGDRREVRVEYNTPESSGSAVQYYFVGTLFGAPSGPLNLLLLIPFLLALAGWLALTRLKLLNRRSDANLEVLGGGPTRVFALEEGRTVVGFDSNRSLTVAAESGGEDQNALSGKATVVRNAKSGEVTVISNDPIMVNNRPTQRRRLKAGDVLRIGEATIVFDDSSEEEPKKG